MTQSIVDLFKAETEIEIKAGELFGIMREAVKAEFLMNAVQCEVPYKYIREMATGEKEEGDEGDPIVTTAQIEIHASEIAKTIKEHVLQETGDRISGQTKIYQMTRDAGQQDEPEEEQLPFPDPEHEQTGVVSGADKYFVEATEDPEPDPRFAELKLMSYTELKNLATNIGAQNTGHRDDIIRSILKKERSSEE